MKSEKIDYGLYDELVKNEFWADAMRILDGFQGGDSSELLLKKMECSLGLNDLESVELLVRELGARDLTGKERLQVTVAEIFLFARRKRFSDCYQHSLQLPAKLRHEGAIWECIKQCLLRISFTRYHPIYEQDLVKFSNSNLASPSLLFKLSSELMLAKYGGVNLEPPVFSLLSDDVFFLDWLQQDYVKGKRLELFVTQIRRALFLHVLSNMDFPDKWVALASAIAWQAWQNEYVHFVSDPEQKLLLEVDCLLQEQCSHQEFKPENIEGLLMLSLMYRPLCGLAVADKLAKVGLEVYPSNLKSLVGETLFDVDLEMSYMGGIKSLGCITDQTSKDVQSQYEENPYPRWTSLKKLSNKVSYAEGLKKLYLNDSVMERFSDRCDVLVAGCGTGSHPLGIAVNMYCSVTAIDITQRSLGYAAMMAEKLNIDNIDFFHMDLLDAQLLGKTFDVIECAGVLHHMNDPELGLKALLKVLKPDGLLKLGLYSSAARKPISAVRKLYLKSGMKPTASNIRSVRQALMSNEVSKECRGVVNYGDFFAMSPCRDLLFHAQEHCYSLSQIEDMIDSNGLRFVAMELQSHLLRDEFLNQFGHESLGDFACLGRFEADHPATFSNMYQFYVRKK